MSQSDKAIQWRFFRLALLFALASFTVPAGYAQQEPAGNRAIYLYQGTDRAQKLLSQAKKEGAVVLYSTMTLEDASPLVVAIETKYGIKVNMWRAVNQKLVRHGVA